MVSIMEQSLVSIIMPAYNSARFIGRSIEAIISQTYPDWELLITDDCSVDDTVSRVTRYCEADNRVKLFVLQENSGPGVARNNSIANARGRFIAFCDSDDIWLPEKLERQIRLMMDEKAIRTLSRPSPPTSWGPSTSWKPCAVRLPSVPS